MIPWRGRLPPVVDPTAGDSRAAVAGFILTPSGRFNSKIQMIKSCASGFRSFENYRVALLFHCGKLQLHP